MREEEGEKEREKERVREKRETMASSSPDNSKKTPLTGVEVAKHNSKENCWVIVHVRLR